MKGIFQNHNLISLHLFLLKELSNIVTLLIVVRSSKLSKIKPIQNGPNFVTQMRCNDI